MAHAELDETLAVAGPYVTLGGSAEIVALADLPGSEARRVAEFGFDRAYFRGQTDRHNGRIMSRLTLSKPLFGLHPNAAVHFLPQELRDRMDAAVADLSAGKDGASPLPTMLAAVDERGGDINLVVCTGGVGPEDYWHDDPGGHCRQPEGCAKQRVEAIDALLPNPHRLAIDGLYDALADASEELLRGTRIGH
jgi:hypothetical protein